MKRKYERKNDPLAFRGAWPKVRLTLTYEDIYSQQPNNEPSVMPRRKNQVLKLRDE